MAQSKTYKIFPFYSRLFDSCMDLFGRDEFTEPLIKSFFDFRNIETYPRYTRTSLFEEMIKNLKDKLSEGERVESKRVDELTEIYVANNNNEFEIIRDIFNVRIHDNLKNMVYNLSQDKETIGFVVETAIALFVKECDDKAYQVIKFSFEQHLINPSNFPKKQEIK
ncbi:hypothetical protein KM915_20800 [Cytobacillus oceanisediminis]|uniref:hypothetical protein n=1 Tax=Cytobacillus oceanisediminis TaxID=665099 RepID=UPI001C2204C0|nr:hypothetical protein [Cytobacillus oceanisediminis]MBU8732490.1 hypothetical protein [Cytobacillus oceanisediminis]